MVDGFIAIGLGLNSTWPTVVFCEYGGSLNAFRLTYVYNGFAGYVSKTAEIQFWVNNKTYRYDAGAPSCSGKSIPELESAGLVLY